MGSINYGIITGLCFNELGQKCYVTKWIYGDLKGYICKDSIKIYDKFYKKVDKDEMMVELL